MSSLDYLKLYGCEDSSEDEGLVPAVPVSIADGESVHGNVSSEDEFPGFEANGEQFPAKKAPASWMQYLKSLEDSEQDTVSDIDSEGSFTANMESTKKRKLTKKEIKTKCMVKKRRRSHQVKVDECGCKLKCGSNISKDDRIQLNTMFWTLNQEYQTNYFRQNVQRTEVQRRRRYRYEEDGPRKINSYVFQLVASNGSSVKVCRKFFLNTFGYGDNCG